MKRENTQKVDKLLYVSVVVLLLLGILMVYSASSFRGEEKYGDSAFFLKYHLIRVLIGLFFLFVFSKIHYRMFRSLTPAMFLVVTTLLLVVLMGPEFHGSKRSILLLNQRFQPSEFMKLTLILYLAAVYAEGKKVSATEGKILASHYIIFLMTVGLVFIEPDLGTAVVLFFLGFTMFYLGGVTPKRLFKMALTLLPLIAIGMFVFPYQRVRLTDYIDSVFGSGTMSYQIKQSIIGLAHGGFLGVGYGGGKQKLFFLPEPFSDFILTSLGEEFGFIGIFLVLTIVMLIVWRGVHIAQRAPDRYGFLLAAGITVMILIGVLMNAGVVINLLPTTGLPFPFLSYGGSSLFVHLMGVGILLNISKNGDPSYKDYTAYRGRISNWQEAI